jgi:hypothetical protein
LPASQQAAPVAARGGASPVWFFAALAATGASAGLSLWSGVDTLNRHSSFEAAGCIEGPASATCSGLQNGGTSAETRTNVLLVTTAALAAGTAVLGLFVVRWRDSSAEARVVVRGSGVSLSAVY